MEFEASTKNSKMVGVYLPQPIVYFLNLYLFTFGLSKTKLLKGLIIRWMMDKMERENFTQEAMIEQIISREQAHWDTYKLQSKPNWKVYAEQLECNMRRKGINDKHINIILKRLRPCQEP